MIHIEIAGPYTDKADPVQIEAAVNAALEDHSPGSPVDISVVVSGDEEIQRLNSTYLGIDAPTDVLSFPSDEVDPDSGNRYLGDILLSYPRAEEQAFQGGHSVNDEIRLLVVHGVLHLLGYDHTDPGEKREMWSVQAKILQRIGSPIQYPPE